MLKFPTEIPSAVFKPTASALTQTFTDEISCNYSLIIVSVLSVNRERSQNFDQRSGKVVST